MKDVLDAPTMSPEDIASLHDVPIDQIENELSMGIDVEKEHTSDESVAKEIALDHLKELPDYYTRLKKMEREE